MSSRGTNFLFKWIANNIHETDDTSVAELTEMLLADAKMLGFSRAEIEDDTGSASEAIDDARRYLDAGLVD
ncbi:hypothetical protein [Mesorhizobium sp. M0491]|uniref:DUF768 domain-containing protein n=1 Tax=Mesorhizobium sp. M0491 TaxID=2956950 RepID=UPI003336D344